MGNKRRAKKGERWGQVSSCIPSSSPPCPPSNFPSSQSGVFMDGMTMLQRSLTRVENFLIKWPFATEWEVLLNDRDRDRAGTGERTAAAAAYQMQSNRLRNSHARRRQRNIFVGAQITSRTLRARLASPESISLGGRITQVETGRFSERKPIRSPMRMN